MSRSRLRRLGSTARALGAVRFVLAASLTPLALSSQALDWSSQCRLPLQTRDSTYLTVYLSLGIARDDVGDRTRVRLPDTQRALALALQEIARVLAPPPVLALADDGTAPFTTAVQPEGETILIPRAVGHLAFTLTLDGRVGDVAPPGPSAWPQADSLLARALTTADSAHALAAVDVTGVLFAKRDTVRLALALTWAPDSTSVRLPVVRMRLPLFTGRGALHSVGNRFPDFPRARAERGEGGDVQLEYDVDASGNVDARSVEIDGNPPKDLRDATLGAVRGWHFSPARVGGCRVRTHLRQTFRYRVVP